MAYNTFVQYVLSNATVTVSGASTLFQGYSSQEISLIVNVKAVPTGTTPSMTFTVSEVDPGDLMTVIGVTKTGIAITGVTTQIITIPVMTTGCLLVTWTVTGTTPSFTQVYATLVDKVTGPAIYDAAGNGPAAVKAASTAAVAADPSLVTAFSPNSPLPTGTNSIGTVTAVQTTPANLQAEIGGLGAVGAVPVGNPVLVGGSDGTDTRIVRTDTSGTVVITPIDDRGSIGSFSFGGDNRLRTGQESLLFFDTFEGSTVNNVLWTQSTSGMSQTQGSSVVTLNNGNDTTNGDYSIFTSTKFFFLTSEFPIYAQFKARLIPQTNSVIELGFGTAATTSAPTNGCFLRIDASGNMRAVINYGGTETTSATLGTLTSTHYYSFEVFILEDSIRIDIDNQDGSNFASTILALPLTQSSNMTVSHIPVFARVYNSGTPAGAANILLSGVSVQQLDLAMNAPWEEQMAGTGRGALADPLTGVQLQNFSNSAAPSTIATGSLSNTSASYTTLGGLFAFNTPAGAETDYLLFAYQVPLGFTLHIWTIQIGCIILGQQSSITPTVLQWGIALGSSAASLATGSPNPPIRQTMGFQQAPKSANVGDTFSPANLTYSPKAPLICFSQKYVQIILRVVSGNATINQINRGFINIDGFLQ